MTHNESYEWGQSWPDHARRAQSGLSLGEALGLSTFVGKAYAERLDGLAPNDPGGPLLSEVAQAITELELLERHLVTRMRSKGSRWRDVGHYLGVTKQAAQRRFTPSR